MRARPLIIGVVLLIQATASADMAVVFPDNHRFGELGGRDFLVDSTIPGEFKTPEGVVAAMLALGDQVKNKKLTAPFNPSTLKGSSGFEGAQPLASYFRGARISGTAFVISFDGGAMRYLNNTSAIQQVVKGAIEATIRKNFPRVERIDYQIDGKIVTGWDA